MKADVAILGAGPTGCAVATWLARAGRHVVLVDHNDPPVDGVGESLLPACAPVLEQLGVDMTGFTVKRGATFTREDRAVRFDFTDALRSGSEVAWHVRRSDFDARLRQAAMGAGAQFLHARVTSVDLPGTVHTSEGTLSAPWVVDALGRQQLLARHLGLRAVHPTLRNVATGSWFRGVTGGRVEDPGDVIISAFDGGWFWFIPLGDGLTSAGFVSTPDGPRGPGAWDRAITLCQDAAERLAGATPVHPLRHHADFTVGSTQMIGEGWALAGDAASFLDPVFSSGLALGLGASRTLADVLLGVAEPQTYEDLVRRTTAAFEPAVHAFYDGSFLEVAFADPASHQSTVRAAIVSLLAGDVFDPGFTAPSRFARRLGSIARMTRSAPG